uniref:Inner centromere protein ARK-binding domain-containing protein n=1 Tax=Cannabis sativa TaxID=3483 RepID=A0A803QDI6_CANSA
MSTIEKLCVQIFERKSWIIDQVRQQTLLFDKHLASKLLIEGLAPPPWFWNSDYTELNGEDIISGVLLSRPRSVIPFSYSHCSVYEKPIVEATNEEHPNGSCSKVSMESRELGGWDCARRASVCVESKLCNDFDHAGCASVGVSTLDHCNTFVKDRINEGEDDSITSPQDQRDTRLAEVSHEAALSLAKIQRSKSRQKALELRTGSKTAKSRLKHANSFSGRIPISFLEDDLNNNCTVEGVKLSDSCHKENESTINSTKSSERQQSSLNAGCSSNFVGEDGIVFTDSIGPLIQQSSLGNQEQREVKVGENRSNEKGRDSSNNVIREDGAAVTQQSNQLPMSVNHFSSHYNNCITAEADVIASRFKGVTAHSVDKDREGRSLEKSSPHLSESAGVIDEEMFENHQENINLSLDEREVLSQEICVEDAVDEHAVSAVQGTPRAEKSVAIQTLQHCYKSSKEKYSLRDPLVSLQVVGESSHGSGLKEISSSKISNVNETKTTTPVIVIPCSISKDETENSKNSQFCTHDATDVGLSQSTEREIAVKSTAKTSFDALLEGSTRNKRRSGSSDTLLALPGEKEIAVFLVNKDSKDHGLKHVLDSQDLQSPQGNIQLDISKGQIEEIPQNEESGTLKGFKSSVKLLDQEDDCNMKDRDLSATTPYTSADEESESYHVSSVLRKSSGALGILKEEARVEDLSRDIFDEISQRALDENQLSYHLEDNFQIRNTDSLTYSDSLHLTGADETMHVLESFIFQSEDEQSCIADEGINFDKLSLPKTSIERASILEQLCRSVCLQTPVSCSSTFYGLDKISNLYQSVPTGLLEGMDKPVDDNDRMTEVFNCAFEGRTYSDCLSNTSNQCEWDIKKPCMSPVRKGWDRIISKSDSSENRMSLIPELPCICEENENVDEVAETYQEGIVSEIHPSSAKREPLAEIIANLVESETEPHIDRSSLDSVNTEFSFNGTHKRSRKNVGNGTGSKRRYINKENHSMSMGTTASKVKTRLIRNQFSKPNVSTRASSRRGGPSLTVTESKPSNVISNITSFIPLVQQKQAVAAITGKRDVKVKALEAAEAAKRLAEKKDNERKAKKEAMKLERVRLEQENLRRLALQKKQKEVIKKIKEAGMAAKKRQREEEERKEKQRKRMRGEETRKQKLHTQKQGKDAKYRTMDDKGHDIKESKRRNQKKMERKNEDDNLQRVSEAEHAATQASTIDDRGPSTVLEDNGVSSDLVKYLKVNNLDNPTRTENLFATANLEKSYDISPYKCSDDEEEEDDVPNTKFVPSWARKSSVALIVSSQERVDPLTIFPPESFCSIDEGFQISAQNIKEDSGDFKNLKDDHLEKVNNKALTPRISFDDFLKATNTVL